MIPREILKKVRQIEIRTNRIVTGAFVCLLVFCSLAATAVVLPSEVAINKEAGRGGWLTVPLHLESGEEVKFMIDTGSPVTVLDKSLESKLGKRVGGMLIGTIGHSQKISGVYKAPELFLGDTKLMTGSNVVCAPLKHFRGILGMDCLQHYCLQLDFAAGKMRFLTSSETSGADVGKEYPLFFSKVGPQRQFISPIVHHAALFGSNTNLVIDTGCHIDGLVHKGAAGKVVWAWLLSLFGTGRFHSGVWDGEDYSNIKVAPVDHANVLGLRFLARHLVTLDFPNRKLYLKQTSIGPLTSRKTEHAKAP